MSIDELIAFIPTVYSKENLQGDALKKYILLLEENYTSIRVKLGIFELSKFLYYACLFFNRFAIPTKYFIDIDDLECFKRCLLLLKKVLSELNLFIDTLSLELDLIRWEIYELLNNNEVVDIQFYKSRLESIHKNSFQLNDSKYLGKLNEYNEKKGKILSLINGIENNQLFMNISFVIPIVPLKQKTKINTFYSNKEIQILLEPVFSENSFFNVTPGSILQTQSSSNWQLGFTNVYVKISGFTDLLKIDSSLFVEIDSEENATHKLYKYLYYLLSDTLWNLKISNKLHKSNWLLEPNDIEKVTYEIESCHNKIEWIHFPFKNILSITGVQNETQELSVNLEKDIKWHEKCLILSKDYLSLGNSNLCIFWLNIGIESFFDQRIAAICRSNSMDESVFLEDYYDKAKAELQKINSKELYDEIKWPEPIPKFVPVFKKIKNLIKGGFLECNQRVVLSNYNSISKHRNKLFHGDIDTLVDVNDAKKAILSYEWIVSNFN